MYLIWMKGKKHQKEEPSFLKITDKPEKNQLFMNAKYPAHIFWIFTLFSQNNPFSSFLIFLKEDPFRDAFQKIGKRYPLFSLHQKGTYLYAGRGQNIFYFCVSVSAQFVAF